MTMSGRILVVDDEEIMRDVLSALLSSESYAVDLAENGAQALERIQEKEYGVMLLDLMMPDVDGFQVLEKLRKSENGPVAIILTAYASIDRVMQAAEQWIRTLDAEPKDGLGAYVHVYPVVNSNAAHLANLITQIFGGAAAPAGAGSIL